MPRKQPMEPSYDGSGRNPNGRFAKGNRLGRGSPVPRKAAAFRVALFASISESDFRLIVASTVAAAQAGESWATTLIFRYLLGEPTPIDLIERLSSLEEVLREDQ